MFDNDDEDDHNFLIQGRLRNRERRRQRARSRGPKPEQTRSVPSRDAPRTGGTVVEVGPGSAVVLTSSGDSLDCALNIETRTRQQSALAVGDEVVVRIEPGAHVVERVEPRRTVLARRDPHRRHQERVVVANVDIVVVVASATDPPFRPRLVDRYMVAISRGGAQAVLAINKLDTADPSRRAELDTLLEPYRALGVPVHLVSASTGEGLRLLVEDLAGARCALVGHSGVGKSSLVTALGSEAAVGGMTEHGRGRHTTSASTLHQLPGGTEIVDTPGVRQFAPHNLRRRELREAFAEFDAWAASCAFSDCTHDHESNCAVISAVQRGEVAEARYDSYLRLLSQIAD